ncbi:putative periplasmic lipoprotein [Ulvibacter antarcticus]|uniref:YD repeat-containing protein n=1 Tax=Ulvibacter antarcticus TaxID=442714 RepID=A0A3L9Z666_9FLAO|nr:hypothetical protein [Ulvibacter antarcticus]RMA65878.1 hypothetical protein BXY75_0292 [Ulvibacter antarcticus]
MKKIYLLFILSIIFSSCSKSDEAGIPLESQMDEELIDDPTVIAQYHTVNYNGDIASKYYFDREGRIYKTHKLSEDTTLNYEFDDTNKLVSIDTKDVDENILSSITISYDSYNRIISIDDRTFEYNEVENYYTEAEYLNYDHDIFGDIEWVQNLYYRFTFQNNTNPIPQYCVYYEEITTNTTTGEVTIYGYCDSDSSLHIYYSNENVSSVGNESSSNYEYDDLINPLFSSENNLTYVLGFLSSSNSYQYNTLYKTISKNKRVAQRYENEDPETAEFLYNYNSFNLPFEMIAQQYYVGQLEYEGLAAKYYYQGDVIPD